MEHEILTETSLSYNKQIDPVRNIEAIYALPLPVGSVHSEGASGWASWAPASDLQKFFKVMLTFLVDSINDYALGTPYIYGEPVQTIMRDVDAIGLMDSAQTYYRTSKPPPAKYAKYLYGCHKPLPTFDPLVTAHFCALLKMRCEYTAIYNPAVQQMQNQLQQQNNAAAPPPDVNNNILEYVALQVGVGDHLPQQQQQQQQQPQANQPRRDPDHEADIDIDIPDSSTDETDVNPDSPDRRQQPQQQQLLPPLPGAGDGVNGEDGDNVPFNLPKTSTYLMRFTRPDDSYAGAIFIVVVHDTFWDPAQTICEHMDNIRQFRTSSSSKKRGKRSMPDFSSSGGPIDMKDIGEMTYMAMCNAYSGQPISGNENFQDLSNPVRAMHHPFHPKRICTLERALAKLRAAGARPELVNFEFQRLVDQHMQLVFPPNNCWRINNSAINWSTFTSLFPWSGRSENLHLALERLLELNTRTTSDFIERREDPMDIIGKYAKQEGIRRSRVFSSLITEEPPKTATTAKEQFYYYAAKQEFINEYVVRQRYATHVIDCLELIQQNMTRLPGLPPYFVPVYDWLQKCKTTTSTYSIIHDLSITDIDDEHAEHIPMTDLDILLDKLRIHLAGDHMPFFDYMDECALSIINLFNVLPSMAGIPLHLLHGFELCTFAKYTALRILREMGILILLIGGSDSGKSEILNRIKNSSIPGTTSDEMSKSKLAYNGAANFDGLIQLSHDIDLAILNGEAPELKSGYTEGEMHHRYLETDDGIRISKVTATKFLTSLIASTDKQYLGDRGMRTRLHHHHVVKVTKRNDIPSTEEGRKIANTIFEGVLRLHHGLMVMASNEELAQILHVDVMLTKMITEKFLTYLKKRRATVGITEDRMRKRVIQQARVATLNNAIMIEYGYEPANQMARLPVDFKQMMQISPYTHDTLQIAVYSISAFLDEYCSPLVFYTMKALLTLANFPVDDYLANVSDIGEILKKDCEEDGAIIDEQAQHISWKRQPMNNGIALDGTRNKTPVLLIDPNFVVVKGNLPTLAKEIVDVMSRFIIPYVSYDENSVYFILHRLTDLICEVPKYCTISNDSAAKLEPPYILDTDPKSPKMHMRCMTEYRASRDLGDRVVVCPATIKQFFRVEDFTDFVKTELVSKNTKQRKLITQLYDLNRNPATPPPVEVTSSSSSSSTIDNLDDSPPASPVPEYHSSTPNVSPLSIDQRIFIELKPDEARPGVEFSDVNFSAKDSAVIKQIGSLREHWTSSRSRNANGLLITEDLDEWAHYQHCLQNYIPRRIADDSFSRVTAIRKLTVPASAAAAAPPPSVSTSSSSSSSSSVDYF